jgi:NAD(P)-dependent dehydrogenase (short-subunit alcohol dehydrogenase family)
MSDTQQADAPLSSTTVPAPRRSRSGPVLQPRSDVGEGRRPLRFSLEGKTAIVTGVGAGVGRSIAWMLAEHNARVMALDLDAGPAEETAAGIRASGGAAHAFACDVSDEAQVRRIFDQIAADHGGIQLLVNNAGLSHVGTVETTTADAFDRLYRVNVRRFHCLQAAVRTWRRAAAGRSSTWADRVADRSGRTLAYGMSKGAL